MAREGQCNCGAIKVTIKDSAADTPSAYCRCLNCRKQGGALGTYVTLLDDDQFVITGTPKCYKDTKTDSSLELGRYFCGDCGSPIYSDSKLFEGKKFIKMGLFDDFPKPAIEAYCKRKPEWEPHVEGTTRLEVVG